MLVFLQIIVHDGCTGEKVGSLGGEKAHSGGIYAVSRHSVLKHTHFWFNGIIHFQTVFFFFFCCYLSFLFCLGSFEHKSD